ncbi:MAG: hypothetical protein GXP59_02345 [Deltaproteobacteria bacterium]|nr:hypothetical protein [Deltaproteobacteria bacterium]
MDKHNKRLHELCSCVEPENIFVEIKKIISCIFASFDFTALERLHVDITRLFRGNYPGYRASNTAYHDVNHTYLVVLALIRIIHGLRLNGTEFTPRQVQLAVYCAFFHDTGLIQRQNDREGTGAKYTIGHEERSINLLKEYFDQAELSDDELHDCSQMIRCTILAERPAELHFHNEKMRILGYVLGTADITAQMADRQYLEKLPSLFNEFQEGGLAADYISELELLEKTDEFYNSIAIKRLNEDFQGIAANVKAHFQERWGIDEDLYAGAIEQNMFYLRGLCETCQKKIDCYQKQLRRRAGVNVTGGR